MRLTYFVAFLLSASVTMSAPTGFNDMISSQNTISPLDVRPSMPNSSPLNQIDSVFTPPPNRPEEYLSGVLRPHRSSERSGEILSNLSGGKSGWQSDILDRVPGSKQNEMERLKGVENILPDLIQGINEKPRISRRNYLEIDYQGRRVIKRGNEFHIQEQQDQGKQWAGASELDDEDDEPYYSQ
ncbi:uncharacterized protein I206_102661 [Kwoniella pini CBS 10737]|uniref:Uncharacterized protein n=1 Tax=Kwoniella pini CBS 10737 TaxID=1296096 RepID=A0A1B9I620_9TREE|nr:uncharacterized protein I206_03014 [Kwoniella pini CBS 10737]OCF50952.1 hypothetical protein I206_03014 [Kwoniella pini CBS 10737]